MFRIFIVLFFYACFAQAQPAMFGASAAHNGVYSSVNNAGFDGIKWKYQTGGKVFSSPVVYKGTIYIGSEDHNLYAIDEKTGKMDWKFTTGGAVHSSAAVYNNVVYFGSYDGYYYAVNTQSGKLVWKFKTGGEKKVGRKGLWTMKPLDMYMDDLYDFFLSSPVINADSKNPTVYFGSSDGKLYALNARTGKQKWAYKTNGLIHSSPALYKGNVYFGSWDTYLYALNANTGKLQWKFKTNEQPEIHLLEGIQGSPTCADDMVYFGARDGFFYSLNANNGKLAWKFDANSSWVLTTPAVKNGTVYIGTSDTYLFLAFDAKTGKEKFRFKGNGYMYSSPALAGNTAYFGDFTGNLHAIDLNAGKQIGKFETSGRKANAAKVLSPESNIDFNLLAGGEDIALYSTGVKAMDKLYTLGSIVSSPAVSGSIVYFGSADGNLYAVKLK